MIKRLAATALAATLAVGFATAPAQADTLAARTSSTPVGVSTDGWEWGGFSTNGWEWGGFSTNGWEWGGF